LILHSLRNKQAHPEKARRGFRDKRQIKKALQKKRLF